MLRESFRAGFAAIRAAGWRGPLLGALSYVPVVVFATFAINFLVFGLILHAVVVVALARVLGASRPEPLPPVPEVDEQGRRVAPPPRPGPPATAADRSPVVALRNAWRLGFAAARLIGLFLLANFGAYVVAVVLSGGRFTEESELVQAVAVMMLATLFSAFVALAGQRVALEGDPRVLVAAAHSVRIAKTNYGVLLLLTAIEPAIAVATAVAAGSGEVPRGRAVAVGVAALVAATVAKVVVTAVSNEVYLRGARLDLPLDPVR